MARRSLRPAAHALAALPLAWLAWGWWRFLEGGMLAGPLAPDPVGTTHNWLGLWAWRLLILALAVSPLARLGGLSRLMPLRRTLGLWAFAYAGLHLIVFLGLDLRFDMAEFAVDIATRPFILVGLAAFLILALLAATSPRAVIRRLGGRRWQRLHRLVYAAGLLAMAHGFLAVKQPSPLRYAEASLLVGLLAVRLMPSRARSSRVPRPVRPAPATG